MNRRMILAASTSLTAIVSPGCTESLSGESKFPTIELSQSSVSGEEAEYDATLLEQFSKSSSARVSVSFTNTSGSESTFEFTASPPFSGLLGRPSDGTRYGLVLIPMESKEYVSLYEPESGGRTFEDPIDAIPEAPTDGCWQAKGRLSHDPILLQKTLDPGQSIRQNYAVLNALEARNCELATHHHFESRSHFESKKWWFKLTVV